MDWKGFQFDYRMAGYGELGNDLVHIEAYKEAALSLVLPPDWRRQLDRLNRIRAVYGTTALEGNPLSEAEVSVQMDLILSPEGLVDPNPSTLTKATREQVQIRNAGTAQAWVKKNFHPNGPPITLDHILEIHRMITESSDVKDNVPGRLRQHEVVVGSYNAGGVHRGAPYADLPGLMDGYMRLINSPRMRNEHPVVRALLAHFFLVTIHPFGDGNGRVSRLVEAGILFQGGYSVHGFYGLSNYFYRNELSYKTSLQVSRRQMPFDVTPFITFGLTGFAEELKGINNFIKSKLNRVVYRAMLVRAFNNRMGPRRRLLNQREYSLLDFLLIQTEPVDPFSAVPSKRITLRELTETPYTRSNYRRVSARTFQRELSRLAALGFIRFARDEALGDWIVDLDFDAIGRYPIT